MGFPIPDTGSVTEDSGVVGGQLLTNGDINFLWFSDTGKWTPETISGAYGSQLVIDDNGVWAYTADNSNTTIQALDSGQTLTEVFTVTSTSGTSTITITINGQDEPPCFVQGTLIETPYGARPIETLKIGDTVLTRDHGPQILRWIGSKHVSADNLENYEKLRPIRVLKDSFGPGVPNRDLLVSPMHRILLKDPATSVLFAQDEILCAAKMLVNGRTIYRDNATAATYFHMLFDHHEVVTSNGCPSESFYPGRTGLTSFEDDVREEVFTLFPDLRALPESYGQSARYSLRKYEAKVLEFRLPKRTDLLDQLKSQSRISRTA